MVDHLPSKQGVASSSLVYCSTPFDLKGNHAPNTVEGVATTLHNPAGIAQLVEQLICNQQVAGSSPIASSIFI